MRIFAIFGLAVYFLILLVAVLIDQKNKTAMDYFFAGRRLPFWALSITFVASWWGAGSALSTADLAYADGLGAFVYYGVPVLISCFVLFLLAPLVRSLPELTQGAIMARHYSPFVGRFLSFLILLFMTLSASSQMVGIGMFFGNYLDIGYETGLFAGTAVVIFYSMFGGFRAVVLTDIIQFIFLTLSVFAVFFSGWYVAGGFEAISVKALALGRSDYLGMSAGWGKYLTYVITFGCSWAIQANVWQRISAAQKTSDARKVAAMAFLIFIPLYLLAVFTGMAGFVLYPALPEGGIVTAIVKDYLSPLAGVIVFIGISAAIMSTMDSLINTAAMTLTLDLNFGKTLNDPVRASRYATLAVSAAGLLIALEIRSILDIAWLASDIITNGVFVPLLAAVLSPLLLKSRHGILRKLSRFGNTCGAIASMTAGLLFSLYTLGLYLKLPLPALWQSGDARLTILGVSISLLAFAAGSFVGRRLGRKH